MMYKLYKTDPSLDHPNAVMSIGVSPQISFIFDENNHDYQEYLRWIAEGNQPLPEDATVLEQASDNTFTVQI